MAFSGRGALRVLRNGGRRRRRLLSGSPQRAVNHRPQLLLGDEAVDFLAIHEQGGRTVDSQRVRLFPAGEYFCLILLGEALLQASVVQLRNDGLVAGNPIQRGKTLFVVPIRARHFIPVCVNVVDEGPVDSATLVSQAIGVHSGVHRPGVNLRQGAIPVYEAHLTL